MVSNELLTDYSDLRQAVRSTRVMKEHQVLSNLIKIDKTSVSPVSYTHLTLPTILLV